MAIFELQGPDGATYEVDAPDQDTAVKAFQGMQQPGSALSLARARAEAEADAARRASEGQPLPWQEYQTRRPWEDYQSSPLGPQVQSYIARAKQRVASGDSTGMPAVDPNTGQPPGVPRFYPRSGEFSEVGSGLQGLTDMASFSLADETAAGLGYGLDHLLPGGKGRPYSEIVQDIRDKQQQAYDDNPYSYMAGMAVGGIGNGLALAKSGLSFGANAAARGLPLLRVALGGAADGGIAGALNGFGRGTDLSSRAEGAAVGAPAGAFIGGAAPYLLAGASALTKPFIAPIASRLFPGSYADAALSQGLRRSGASADDIANRLAAAQADGQGMYTIADAMGNAGQRLLSTAARNPHEGRQALVEALQGRQAGQADRITNALAEAFAAPDTAAQRAASLTSARRAAADANYAAARQGAGPVDVSGAISAANDVLTPGVNRLANPGSGIADDSLEGAVRRAKSLLTDGQSQLTDFNSVLRAKQDIGDQIAAAVRAGQNNRARILGQISDQLDAALEKSSPGYRQANDLFRTQSGVINAVDTGTAAASGRVRAPDNIQTFNAMTPDQQNAFRAGYVDPLIARVQNAASAGSTNKARTLLTEKTAQEFPAFAVPGSADQLAARLSREQGMFETANAALGGSKTADNLADAADLNRLDPSVMTNLLHGRPIQAAMTALGKGLNEARGLPPSVISRLSGALMGTDPGAARLLLSTAARRSTDAGGRKAIYSSVLARLGSRYVTSMMPAN
ncbi:hypothetical protein [Mesorhizobium sp. B2-4-17]|uniref:hypothetical protein n=1 Tax=Mesorhizobium sp. B2-4-17 TaxID=2589932 RepID=UPI00112C1C77|nr:hypothetical protein [Mesorhizobium sp. B2-4-17]TPK85324.1 hypothetical protein FJ548_17435 [Mesorhizobium sp. B2-4-17]